MGRYTRVLRLDMGAQTRQGYKIAVLVFAKVTQAPYVRLCCAGLPLLQLHLATGWPVPTAQPAGCLPVPVCLVGLPQLAPLHTCRNQHMVYTSDATKHINVMLAWSQTRFPPLALIRAPCNCQDHCTCAATACIHVLSQKRGVPNTLRLARLLPHPLHTSRCNLVTTAHAR